MKSLVVYDSAYGNTATIGQAIAAALGSEVQAGMVGAEARFELGSLDLLVVGSPTQGGRPTAAIQAFLSTIPPNALQNTAVAAFDTRFAPQARGLGLRLLMRLIGFAAPRIARELQGKGGQLAVSPEGFIVTGKEGPLKSGEAERATAWAQLLLAVHPSVKV